METLQPQKHPKIFHSPPHLNQRTKNDDVIMRIKQQIMLFYVRW